MRGGRIHSVVTKTGQVIRGVVGDEESEQAPDQPVADAPEPDAPVLDPPAPDPQAAEPPGHSLLERLAAMGRMDARRLTALTLFGIICLFVVALIAAGLYQAGRWGLSRGTDRDMAVAGVEDSRRATEMVAPRKPVITKAPTHASDYRAMHEETGSKFTEERPLSRIQKPEDKLLRQERTSPEISSEPVADYWDSIREMESVLETRTSEIGRITAELRNMRDGDEDG